MFDEMLAIAESLEEYDSGGSRGYHISIWYSNDEIAYVVDYDDDGAPQRIQKIGTTKTWFSS